MAQRSGSYYDDYMRSNAMLKHCGEKNAKKLLTDRNAYISFLEVQLERVSAACLTSQTFEKRLAGLESTQNATDQKLESLSKVFRLNQEYVEQTSQQARSELAGHAAKMDSCMNELSAELMRQQPRMATLEEQFQHCQEYLPRLVESSDAALNDVKEQTQREMEELKAQVIAFGTRMENIHSSHVAKEQMVETLINTATRKLDKELALFNSFVSEKSFQLSKKKKGSDLKQLVRQVTSSLRAEALETADCHEIQIVELQQQVKQLQNKLEHGHIETKNVLRKCLDSQHFLGGTVVALQSEVDELKNGGADAVFIDSKAMPIAVEHLLKRQNALKDALQLLQVCVLEAQQACEDRNNELTDRLAAAEDLLDIRIDDLRSRMLAALNDIGDRLHEDAYATSRTTPQAAMHETKSELDVKEHSDALEKRFCALENTVLSLERSRATSDALCQISENQASRLKRPTTDIDEFQKQQGRLTEWKSKQDYKRRIRELEERLHRRGQLSEDHRASFVERTSSKSPIASSGYPRSTTTNKASRRDDTPKTSIQNLKMTQATTASKSVKSTRPQFGRR